jgi:hypothetical protein
MKKNDKKTTAVKLMLNATLEEYLMYLNTLVLKLN